MFDSPNQWDGCACLLNTSMSNIGGKEERDILTVFSTDGLLPYLDVVAAGEEKLVSQK